MLQFFKHNIIKDLDNDGNLELALLYKDAHDSSIVRIFRLADPNEVEEETTEEEQEYDEFGNPIDVQLNQGVNTGGMSGGSTMSGGGAQALQSQLAQRPLVG